MLPPSFLFPFLAISLLCLFITFVLAGETRCKALTWGQGQCKLKALPNSKFCGNHKGKQPYGPAPEDKEVNEEAKEDVQEEVQEVVQEAVQEAMELVPYDKPTLHFLPAYLDIDMFFVPFDVAEMGHISNFWSSTAGATLKIYSERPPYLQLFSHPVALFVPVPDAHQVQEYKQLLCTALYKKGIEIPLPTSPPFQNYFNGSNVAKRAIKVTAAQAQAALETLGVEVVWAAQFGGKTPLEIWKTLFSNLLPKPMAYPMAFDLGSQSPGPQHICSGYFWGEVQSLHQPHFARDV